MLKNNDEIIYANRHLKVTTEPEVQWEENFKSTENMGRRFYVIYNNKMMNYLYVQKIGTI